MYPIIIIREIDHESYTQRVLSSKVKTRLELSIKGEFNDENDIIVTQRDYLS